MRSVEQIGDLAGKTAVVRVDFNVLVQDGRIKDEIRIKKALPTLGFLLDKGANLFLITHLGKDGSADLAPVIERFWELSGFDKNRIKFFENVRKFPGEMANDEAFAKELSSMGDVYVNEAFSVSHREHASVVGIADYLPSYAGFEFIKEVEELSRSFHPPRPSFLILGGAKFETKLPIVEKLLPNTDYVFIGGGMASAVSNTSLNGNPKLFFCTPNPSAIDANSETLELIKDKIDSAKFILWNGPLGDYENGHMAGTLELAKMLAGSGKEVVVGGGDTLAAIEDSGLVDKFSFVSIGGGAMLHFLAHGTMPGIKALG